MSDTEQNKTEEPTPFKLKQARKKGTVARGTDLGFFATLVALCLFSVIAGVSSIEQLAEMMRSLLTSGITDAQTPERALVAISWVYLPAIRIVALLGITVFAIVILFEVLQLRGLIFSATPLKPDFSRINPGKGLKRLFSMKTLKDALKNLFKMAVYSFAAYLVIHYCVRLFSPTITDTKSAIAAMTGGAFRMLFVFTLLAFFFAILDQIIARREFLKQMRMSKSELQREHKDREGEPRLKQKRKQLHGEFAKQAEGLGNLPGSDLLIVNPEHVAVALRYQPSETDAPIVTTKGRNRFALHLKDRAFQLSIPIIENKPLARGLFKSAEPGQQIPQEHFRDVAEIYMRLKRERPDNG